MINVTRLIKCDVKFTPVISCTCRRHRGGATMWPLMNTSFYLMPSVESANDTLRYPEICADLNLGTSCLKTSRSQVVLFFCELLLSTILTNVILKCSNQTRLDLSTSNKPPTAAIPVSNGPKVWVFTNLLQESGNTMA